MHYKLVDEKPKTLILVFETNDEFRARRPRSRHRSEIGGPHRRGHRK
jgi:hypothetical protein